MASTPLLGMASTPLSPPAPVSSPLVSPSVTRTPFQPNSRGVGESSAFDLLDTLAELASALSSSSSPRTNLVPAAGGVEINEVKVTAAPTAPVAQAKSKVGMSFDTMNGLILGGEQRSLRRPRAMSEPWSVDDNHAVMQLAALSTKAHIALLSPLTSPRKTSTSSSSSNEGPYMDGGNSSEMLTQYSSKYNTFGRIGIYTREERAAIIKRFRERRSKRVWKKKIRYHCRKNLAATTPLPKECDAIRLRIEKLPQFAEEKAKAEALKAAELKEAREFFSIEKIFPEGSFVGAGGAEVKTAAIAQGPVILYFAAGLDEDCVEYLPRLKEAYAKWKAAGQVQSFEVVYVSCDRSQEAADASFAEMGPMVMLKFEHRDKFRFLLELLKLRTIPTLVAIKDGTAKIVESFDACQELLSTPQTVFCAPK